MLPGTARCIGPASAVRNGATALLSCQVCDRRDARRKVPRVRGQGFRDDSATGGRVTSVLSPDWVARASRVLVKASRFRELFGNRRKPVRLLPKKGSPLQRNAC